MTQINNVRGRRVLFGDSHSALYAGVQGIDVRHIGAITMHRVGRDGPSLFALDQMDLTDVEGFGFVFGEIDVRVHVAEQTALGRPQEEIIETLVRNYIGTIRRIAEEHPNTAIAIFSVVPPSGLDYPGFHQEFPRNGPDADRARWSQELNSALNNAAAQYGFSFVD